MLLRYEAQIVSSLSILTKSIAKMEHEELSSSSGNKKMMISNCKRSKLHNFSSSSLVLIATYLLFGTSERIIKLTRAQCPVNTMTSFERIGGVTAKDMPLTVLYTPPNISSMVNLANDLSGTFSSSATATNLNIPITAECNNRCRRNPKCRAFLVDYARHTCYSIDHSNGRESISSQVLMRTPTPIQLIHTNDRTSYFEKVCLNLPAVECERAWIYERVLAYHIHGHDDKIIDDVPSRLKCQEHCLNEREFKCRSGEYDYITMQCRLSMNDRHTKPNSFKPTVNNVDYFENQCVPLGNQCDAFDRFDDMDLGRAEIMRPANSSDDCQRLCTQTIKAFICRSFTWNPITNKCYLNSDNTFMVGGLDRLNRSPGLTYYQRNDCIDLKLECDTGAMTLNLRTNEPFRGRMYVRDDPNSCETLGRSSLTSSLSIPFQSRARCATRELPNRYTSVVVVQQHPLIQRKSDRYIKVVCDFQTPNKTITSTYNVVANPWTSTAMINATSFAPKIRLRITDKFGVDIAGAKLGDELYLRIEAETESVYDMVARSVLAKSGTTDESIVLIDKDGCPTDYRIFPPLKKLNRRTILGKFDAFKFSSDVVVRFQVDVQFCLNQCPIANCDHNQLQLLNTAEAPQLVAETYSPGSLPGTTTTLSPQQANMVAQLGGPQLTGSGDSGIISEIHSSTQASVPSQQQQQQQQQLRPSSSDSSKTTDRGYESIYYNANTASNHVFGRQPSIPANYPLNNYTGNSSPLLDSLTSDPQVFESRSAPNTNPTHPNSGHLKLDITRSSNHQQLRQQLVSNSIDSNANVQNQESSQVAQGGETNNLQREIVEAANRRRRKRSSTVESPSTQPPHLTNVPLHREIIVESSPTSGRSNGNQDGASRQRKSRLRDPKKASVADGWSKDGSMGTNDTNGNKLQEQATSEGQQEQQIDRAPLLCTTRHSLVFISVAFCTVQLLTMILCLVTWLHRKDSIKFKVRHPVNERLY